MGIVDNLINQPCQLVTRARSGAADAYGMPMVEEPSTVSTVCYHEPASSSEDTAGRESEIGKELFFFLADEFLDGTDAVVVGGATYEFEGPPGLEYDPFSRTVDHIEVIASIITG